MPAILIIAILLAYNCAINAITKEECLINKAVQRNEINRCNKIPDEYYRNSCITQVNSPSIFNKNKRDIDSCNAITNADQRDQCLSQFIQPNFEKSVCDLMTGRVQKERCIALHVSAGVGDPSLCGSLTSTPIKDTCFYRTGIDKLDGAWCEKMSGLEFYSQDEISDEITSFPQSPKLHKENCFDIVYFKRASKERNPALCDLISYNYINKQYCKENVENCMVNSLSYGCS